MNKASEYGISIRLVAHDGEDTYEARVAELPDVAAFGETYAEAYESALEAIEGLQEMFAEKGKSLPPPEAPEASFSGRVTLRMSKSLHEHVHRRARLDGVSLNQWIVETIAGRIDGSSGTTSTFFGRVAHRDTSGNNRFVSSAEPTSLIIPGSQRAMSVVSPSAQYREMTTHGQH